MVTLPSGFSISKVDCIHNLFKTNNEYKEKNRSFLKKAEKSLNPLLYFFLIFIVVTRFLSYNYLKLSAEIFGLGSSKANSPGSGDYFPSIAPSRYLVKSL